jgi:hypothetical protein
MLVLLGLFLQTLRLQVDAVLVPKSMMKFLEDFTAKKAKKPKGKKGNSTISVAEALKAGNASANATSNATRKGAKDAEDPKATPTYLANGTGANATAPGRATSGASDVVFTLLVTVPLLLASLLVL